MPNDELDLGNVEAVVLCDRADGFTSLDPVQDRAHRVAVEHDQDLVVAVFLGEGRHGPVGGLEAVAVDPSPEGLRVDVEEPRGFGHGVHPVRFSLLEAGQLVPRARAMLTEVFVAGVEPGPSRVLIRGVGYGAGVGGGLGAAFVVVLALVSIIMGGGVASDLDLLVLVLFVGAIVGAVAGVVFGFIAATCVVGLARGWAIGRVRAVVAVVAAVGAATAVLIVFGVLVSNDDGVVVVAAVFASAAAASAIAWRLGPALTRPSLGS